MTEELIGLSEGVVWINGEFVPENSGSPLDVVPLHRGRTSDAQAELADITREVAERNYRSTPAVEDLWVTQRVTRGQTQESRGCRR